MQEEGVIRFDLRYTYASESPQSLETLNAWRGRLWNLGLIGRQAERYGGVGYGNVSRRLDPLNARPDQRRFIISGSQTGELAWLEPRHYCVVSDWDVQGNRVYAHGPIRPSSESLTHGMLYGLDDEIRVIFHVHSAAVWHAAARLGLPVTDPLAAYGTPEMARAVVRLFRETNVRQTGVFTMGGHEDGVVAFGGDENVTGRRLLSVLVRS